MEKRFVKAGNTYVLTHIINPSHFYLMDFRSGVQEEKDLIENILQNVPRDKKVDPHPGESVAISIDGKLRRFQVDAVESFNSVKTCILWATDYGMPMYTTKYASMIPLDETIAGAESSIKCCGLDILPAFYAFDFKKNKQILQPDHIWCKSAMKIFERIVKEALIIQFIPTKGLIIDGVQFGKMIITTEWGEIHDVADVIIQNGFAYKPHSNGNFEEQYNASSMKNIERWNDNLRAGGVLKGEDGYIKLYDYKEDVGKHRRDQAYLKVAQWKKKIAGFEYLEPDGVEIENDSDEKKMCKAGFSEESELEDFVSVSQASSRKSQCSQ